MTGTGSGVRDGAAPGVAGRPDAPAEGSRPAAAPAPRGDGAGLARPTLWTVVTLLAGLTLVAAAFTVPLSVRDAAPFGSEQTVDFDRGIAVLGAEVSPNYDGMDRLALDLRAYGDPLVGDRFDFLVSVRDLGSGATVRRASVSVPADRIAAQRPAFAPSLTDVRFDAIAGSAGASYYVDVERGPASAGAVVTLWGVQTYSTQTAAGVFAAAVDGYDLGWPPRATRLVLLALCLLTLTGVAALVGSLVSTLAPGRRPAASPTGPGRSPG